MIDSCLQMLDKLEINLKGGLRGKYIHLDPLKVLEGLEAATANAVPPKGIHSCWQILYHIVYWQELMLSACKGESVQWPKNNDASWPENAGLDTHTWTEIVSKFKKGIEVAETLTTKIDSIGDLPAWPKVPLYIGLMHLIQHNSFHFGELVATRQALGFWPPPEYKQTF